jgi:predicted protein tyrosine phosphatase
VWIENVAGTDVERGRHHDCGANSMLIQILDGDWTPEPQHQFRERYQFVFLDLEDTDPGAEESGITDSQAQQLVKLLQHAFDERMNVIVHCTAGVCRSGAIVEVGVMMGFTDPESFRAPNMRVKSKMLKVLGWSYD